MVLLSRAFPFALTSSASTAATSRPCRTEHCLQVSEPFLHLVLRCFAALQMLQQVGDVQNSPFVVYDIWISVAG